MKPTEANEALEGRLREPEAPRGAPDQLAVCLRTVHRISQLVHGPLALDDALAAIPQILVETGGFGAACLELATELEGTPLERRSEAGAPPSGQQPLSMKLEARGQAFATLHVWPSPDLAASRDSRELLAYALPPASLALSHALALHALSRCRSTLEERVAERTREMREPQVARERLLANLSLGSPPPELIEARGTPRATLLIVEDDPGLRAAIAGALGDAYRLLLAGDGASALALAQRHTPDLLVSEAGAPDLDGLELARRFRALPGLHAAPVVLLTSQGAVDDRLSRSAAGAVDCMAKPLVAEELRARIHALLELRDLTRRLAQAEKLAALGRLSLILAHELRNPANALVNALPPLRSLLPPALLAPETPTARLLDVAEQCAAQIRALSQQLLGFHRPGALEYEEQPFRLILQRALTLTQPVLERVVVKNGCAYPGTLRCAVPLVVQVLVNLLENAAHAAGPGGWISIADHVEDGRLVIEVADSGPGVPPELRERIFDPFFTTKPPGQGTGLGLAISREIVQRHAGTLAAQGTAQGTVFAIALPLPAAGSPTPRSTP